MNTPKQIAEILEEQRQQEIKEEQALLKKLLKKIKLLKRRIAKHPDAYALVDELERTETFYNVVFDGLVAMVQQEPWGEEKAQKVIDAAK